MTQPCALITGGTRGIGYAVALCLAEAGYNLVLTYASNTRAATTAVTDITHRYGVTVHHLSASNRRLSSVDKICAFCDAHDITLRAVVLNAGETCREPFETITPKQWENIFRVNVQFPVHLLQQLLPHIEAGGSVVFTGSLMGIHPHATSLPYGVSKAAVHALARNLVKFLKPYNIRVNAVAPGFVKTDWQQDKPTEIRRSIEEKLAAGRFITPDELAPVYRMLIENPCLNGEIIVPDGGYSYK